MKKAIIIIVGVFCGIISCLKNILLILSAMVFIDFFYITDHSAVLTGRTLTWKDCTYTATYGEYTCGEFVARTSDYNDDIYEIVGDEEHNFVEVSYGLGLDQELYVAKDYVIPTSGEITAVYWNRERITDETFCNAVAEMLSTEWETFEYKTEALFMLTDTQHVRKLYLAYNGCPVGTEYAGYMGKINGKWVIIPTIPDYKYREEHTVICKEIPDEYNEIIEPYFS